MSKAHPAVTASESSAKFAMAKDKESWLGLFAEDAFLADPVGKSMLDPEGKGHRGKEAIERFWDNAIAKANLTLDASQRIACDNTCVAVLRATNDLGGGIVTVVDMVGLYEVNEDGKLSSLKVYWDFDKLLAQLKEQGIG
ncbi:MAG: nuclear transport factor 2 family protein [Myxococcales bacterium]|nr:nuclear transport factor 2 family protein [Myxococcales bacterium]MDH3844051.1 nuclear transport factor 2 family protein [Myxococcales bacterium]